MDVNHRDLWGFGPLHSNPLNQVLEKQTKFAGRKMAYAGISHTVLLRRNGRAVAYSQVSPGMNHTVLLRSDGLLLAATTMLDNAPFHPWMKDFHTSRFLQGENTQCFLEVMAKLLHAVRIVIGNATFPR